MSCWFMERLIRDITVVATTTFTWSVSCRPLIDYQWDTKSTDYHLVTYDASYQRFVGTHKWRTTSCPRRWRDNVAMTRTHASESTSLDGADDSVCNTTHGEVLSLCDPGVG